MKFTKYSLFGFVLASVAVLSSCQDDYDAPGLDVPVAKLTPNTTLADFKLACAEVESGEVMGLDENGKVVLRTPGSSEEAIDGTEEAAGTPAPSYEPCIIHGRVVSSDVSGNIFKTLVIQDETSALNLSINEASMYTNYRVGQDVVIDATGLWGGKYMGLVCLGAGANQYGDLVTSRMTMAQFQAHSELNGLPLPASAMKYITYGEEAPVGVPYTVIMNSITLPTGGDDMTLLQSQLIEINNVTFVEAGEPYAYKDENVSRTIRDENGGTLTLRNSGKSKFYNTLMPEGKVTVRGILSYYLSKTSTDPGSGWQLLIRDLDDVIVNGAGSKEKPYTVEEAIAEDNNGRSSWVEGYIVGSVKAGVTAVSSNDDIIFGADAELDNNLVIAPAADCKDYTQCMTVSLTQGSRLRQYANLADNPDNLGHKFAVSGLLKEYLGLHGVAACPGDFSDFLIEGVDIGIKGTGSGTKSDPYSVDRILSIGTDMDNVWVEGYIIGFVEGTDYLTGAQLTNDIAGKNYIGNNVILAPSADITDLAKAIPVRVERSILGLKDHPELYKQKVAVRGKTGTFLNVFGMPSTEKTDYVIF